MPFPSDHGEIFRTLAPTESSPLFSGIIESMGAVKSLQQIEGALKLTLQTGFTALELGESIAVNGVCLTVVDADTVGQAVFFVSTTTLTYSNLGALKAGARVNLERAVTLSTRLSGHLVQGHIDEQARMESAKRDGESWLVEFSLPAGLRAFCVEKGAIALNGVSLTLNAVGEVDRDGRFLIGITLIPHTWDHTNLQDYPRGAKVNVEVDVIAKYVERACLAYLTR
jgi:riboflavin synthase